ncbi:hypothetical protein BC829DRAFT_388039 [Chytridium lagenaria]|nr:hypothetical protein BC829DRAFT_388039 [Chytridium lagenaria]
MGKSDIETGPVSFEEAPPPPSEYLSGPRHRHSSNGIKQDAISGLSAEDAAKMNGLPPDYFEVSLLPKRTCCKNVPPLEASTATFKREKKGGKIMSHPDELYKFFMTHLLEKPGMDVWITGTHQETYTRTETVSDGNGGTRTETRTETRTVTDFTFGIDVSHYIQNDWVAVFALPKMTRKQERQNMRAVGAHVPVLDAQSGLFRKALEEFTMSKNLLKEIHLDKEIPWDYDNLRRAFKQAIRSTGYFGHIDVSFVRRNAIISVFSSSPISRMAQSWWTWVCLGITCLWLIFLPLFCITRKKISGRLAAHYPMMVDGGSFFQNNVLAAMGAARGRAMGLRFRGA